jgi:hypothetical protein
MTWGIAGFGSSPYGIGGTFSVSSVAALNPNRVRVIFSQPIDSGSGVTDPSNYSIPGLTVVIVTIESTTSVLLVTSTMNYQTYTLTVSDVESNDLQSLDINGDSFTFTGFPSTPQFIATPQSRVKIQIVFSNDMLNDSNLTNPLNYTVQDFEGNPITVTSVDANGVSTIRRVTLHLGSELAPTFPYALIIDSSIKSTTGLSVQPSETKFTWVEYPLTRDVPLSAFSGEVSGGLFGDPAGLVFFSPSLVGAVPNSILQVDSVSVCILAYDTYTIPSLPDPKAFYTFSTVGQPGTLNTRGMVLWAGFYALGEARYDLTDRRTDTGPAASDGRCVATLTIALDPTKAPQLNSPDWALFDGVGPVTSSTFKTADNSAPIGPGSTTVITIVP